MFQVVFLLLTVIIPRLLRQGVPNPGQFILARASIQDPFSGFSLHRVQSGRSKRRTGCIGMSIGCVIPGPSPAFCARVSFQDSLFGLSSRPSPARWLPFPPYSSSNIILASCSCRIMRNSKPRSARSTRVVISLKPVKGWSRWWTSHWRWKNRDRSASLMIWRAPPTWAPSPLEQFSIRLTLLLQYCPSPCLESSTPGYLSSL